MIATEAVIRNQGKDLGTYHFKVWYSNGKAHIFRVSAGRRYERGYGDDYPIDAKMIPPTWESEERLVSTIIFGLTDNGCDCNKLLNWERSQQMESDREYPCGDEWQVTKLVMVRPDGSEVDVTSRIIRRSEWDT